MRVSGAAKAPEATETMPLTAVATAETPESIAAASACLMFEAIERGLVHISLKKSHHMS